MKGHKPVFWNQGLFLHPQHFQMADAANNVQFEALRTMSLPYFWGVRRLTFAQTGLENAISIEQLEVIFPSGAVVNAPNDASILPLAIDKEWPAPDKAGTLYLGLALPRSSGNNASLNTAGTFSGKRFVYDEDPEFIVDMYGSSPATPVQRLSYAPVLFRDIDKERYSDFECMPIAVLRRVGEQIEFVPNFMPPLMVTHGNDYMQSLIREVLDIALSCAGRLAGYKARVSSDIPDMRFILSFNALGILNRQIPLLTHIQSVPQMHPWHVYGALRILAGELSSFYDDMDCLGRNFNQPDGIAPYNHEDPNQCFPPLCKLITTLINNLNIDASKTLVLQPEPPYFMADIPDEFLSSTCQHWLSIRKDHLTNDEAEDLPRFMKLGAKDRLNMIIAKAVSGVPLTRSTNPPPGFLKRSDTAWYKIDTNHPLWQHIVAQKKIYLFWEDSPEEVDVLLVITGV